jgi:Ni,Fe-hydrogenase III component G
LPGKTRADDVYTAVTVFISMMTNTRACCFVTAAPEEHLSSLCAFMKNASWVERESSEMLNLVYYNLPDTRKLLLDYSTTRGVLHKCYSDVFSSHFFKNYYFVNYDAY